MEIKKTALYDTHEKLGAKLIEFAGYYMPVQYKGIIDEHKRVRSTVGLFDVSHMGEFEVRGPNAEDFIQKMTTNNVKKLNECQVQYSALCYEDGGIVDDLLVYRYADRFIMVVNAANLEKDFNWLHDHLINGVELINRSDEFTLLAIQGRKSIDVLRRLTLLNLENIQYYWFKQSELAGVDMMISRTGYTGEDGFELMIPAQDSLVVWNALMESGEEFNIEPIGLGARDTLRLEVAYCLYGNDIDQTTLPLEAGLGWITKLKKGDFIGRDAIMKLKENGLTRKLVGFELNDRAFPRKGYDIFADDVKIGHVTSGTFSPMLEKSIGMGYVDIAHTEPGSRIDIAVRNKKYTATVVNTPFYKRPY